MLYLRRFYRALPPQDGGGDPSEPYQQPITVTVRSGCDPVNGAYIQVQSTVYDTLSRASSSTVLVFANSDYSDMVGSSNTPYVDGRATDTVYLPTGGRTYYVRVYARDTVTKDSIVPTQACSTDPTEPEFPADGTFIRNACNGYNLQQVVANGSGGERWGDVVEYNSTECGYVPPEPPEPVYGCMDPEALNYDPSATVDNGLCDYPIRMTAALPPALAVAGNPITAELRSGETGRAASKAVAELTVGALAEGSSVSINGSTFRFALNPRPGEFYDALTLSEALLEEPALTGLYDITQSGSVVRLEALQTGSAYTPVITITGGGLTQAVTPGVDALRSQTKKEWGCYVELWACSGTYGLEVSKDTAVMVERLERLYAPGNSYRFGLEATLRRNLRHSLFTEGDRLQAYFVRYGEMYLPEGKRQVKRFPLGESQVLWALEGALPLQAQNDVQAPLLLNRCQSLSLPLHAGAYAEALYVLQSGIRLTVGAAFIAYDGSETQETVIDTTPAGGVAKLALQPVLTRAYQLHNTKRLVKVELTVKAYLGAAETTLGTMAIKVLEPAPRLRCLAFLTSLGAYETFWLQGYSEPASKRSVQLYGRGMVDIPTTSTRTTGVRKVDLQRLEKLQTGLLDRLAFEFVSSELGTSPEVYEYTESTYNACNISDMAMDASATEAEYYVSLTLERGMPHNTITS